MALVNPNIALSIRPVELASPLEQYGKIAALQSAQNQNALAQYQLGAAQRSEATQNALNSAYAQSVDPATGAINYNKLTGLLASGGGASQIPAIEKTRRELETAALTKKKTEQDIETGALTQQKMQTDLLGVKLKQSREFLDTIDPAAPDAPQRYLAWHEANHRDPVIGPALNAQGVSAEQARQSIMNAVNQGPQAFADLLLRSKLGTEKFMAMNAPQVVAPGSTLLQGGKAVYTAPFAPEKPPAPTNLAKLQNELAALPPGDPRRPQYEALIRKEITPVAGTTIKLPPQENAFESGLGKGQSERILANQVAAQDAAEILRTNQVGRDLLKAGAITGTGADFLVGFNNALKQVGIDFGYADAAANSQAYVATLGANVGRIIKQFGAGTGLSDADRDFAEKIAGGKIALTETALRKILDINDRASNRVIDLHNKNVSGIKTNIPLTVEKPVFQRPAPSAANQIPGNAPAPAAAPASAIPQGAIDRLKAGGGTDAQFDAIFGPGAAKRARGGK